MANDDGNSPTETALCSSLKILWSDLFHVRSQTWQTILIDAAFLGILLAVDTALDNLIAIFVTSFIAALAILSGIAATMHHRRTQTRTLKHITNIEIKLGLVKEYIINDISPAFHASWYDAANIRNNSTPIYILRIHFLFLLFSLLKG